MTIIFLFTYILNIVYQTVLRTVTWTYEVLLTFDHLNSITTVRDDMYTNTHIHFIYIFIFTYLFFVYLFFFTILKKCPMYFHKTCLQCFYTTLWAMNIKSVNNQFHSFSFTFGRLCWHHFPIWGSWTSYSFKPRPPWTCSPGYIMTLAWLHSGHVHTMQD